MEYVWQHREIRFDCPAAQLKLRKGENVIDTMPNVEDTKGNPDEGGTFKFTNIRAIWYSDINSYINLSIGYDTVTNCEIKTNYSANTGNTQSIVLRCKFNNSKFEFIFTSKAKESSKMGTVFQGIREAYESTKLYRDIRMRGAIVQDKDLVLLPHETIVNKYNNVWNLASEATNIGTFVVTNVRIVWYHTASDNFNASIPYIQIKSIKKKDSKAGPAVVVETFPQVGEAKGYTIGFQTDQLSQMLQELTKLHKLYMTNPFFGVEGIPEEKFSGTRQEEESTKADEDAEVFDNEYNERNANMMNYLTAATGKEVKKDFQFFLILDRVTKKLSFLEN